MKTFKLFMTRSIRLCPVAFIVAIGFSMVGCPTDPPEPTVTGITVNPATANVVRGQSQDFTATVSGTNDPPQTVWWSLIGGVSGTSISAAGRLTVAHNETATSLTIRATSTHGARIGTATVTVTAPPPPVATVTNVTVNPATATVARGGNQNFTAAIFGTNNPPRTVTWTVEGGGTGTSISADGNLTVAANETASTLTVRATSTHDTTRSGTAIVTALAQEQYVPGFTLVEQLAWLRENAFSGFSYIIEIPHGNQNVIPAQTTLPSGRTNLTVTLRGNVQSEIRLVANGILFNIPSGVSLVLGENITLQGTRDNEASLVQINNGGTLIMNERSRITGNTATTNGGGGVRVFGGTFTMYGGEIFGNTATRFSGGGGVIVVNEGTFVMYDGEIFGNTTGADGGGGVRVSRGTFVMHGGEISGNTAGTDGGGGVRVSGGIFSMHGGEIFGNTTGTGRSDGGGGVSVDGGATFRISNGIIHGSNASEDLRNRTNGAGVALHNMGTALVGIDGAAPTGLFLLSTVNHTVHVINGVLQLPQGNSFVAQLARLDLSGNDGEHTIEIHGNEDISPAQARLPSGRTGLRIALRGRVPSQIRLSANGALFDIPSGVTLVLDENITLVGRNVARVGVNNYRPVVIVNNGGTLIMNGGARIMGNANTFRTSGVFGAGGVCVASGGTFRVSNGVIYGSNEAEGLRNTAYASGAALNNLGTSQRGTFTPAGVFTSLSSLSTANNTIRVVNGQFVP